MTWDFEEMRKIIMRAPATSIKVRRTRLHLFDLWRYQEEYEKIFQMIDELK